MLKSFFNLYLRILGVLEMPRLLDSYLAPSTGAEYGLGLRSKVGLLLKMRRALRRIPTASHFLEHVAMVTSILRIPRSVEGCVVECGCYKGGSTASLSLACGLIGRELHVFDSFAGLPEPGGDDRAHVLTDQRAVHTYTKGAWRGGVEEVNANVARHGNLAVCRFHPGYFADSLPGFAARCVFVFLDVDLVDSMQTCVRQLWPLLQDGCLLYTHEAPHHEIASLFFDREWWERELHCNPPGLVGAGSGLGLIPSTGGFRSDLGYTVKNPRSLGLKEIPQPGIA